MHRIAVALLSGLLAAPASASAQALPPGVGGDVRVEYYDVSGSTPRELRESMIRHGPRDGERPVYGYHSWNVRWRFSYAPENGRCRMTDVFVEVTSVTQLPRWRPERTASARLVAEWEAFVERLRAHEDGHRDLGLEAAAQVRGTLLELEAPRCTGMSAAANAAAHRVLDHYRELNRQYDVETRNGRTQGAVWPPTRAGAP
jgi:predicted secreted Zn-dependent protease